MRAIDLIRSVNRKEIGHDSMVYDGHDQVMRWRKDLMLDSIAFMAKLRLLAGSRGISKWNPNNLK